MCSPRVRTTLTQRSRYGFQWCIIFNLSLQLMFFFSFLCTARRLRVRAEERPSARTPRDCGVTCKRPKKAKTAKTVASSIRRATWSDYDDDWRVTHRYWLIKNKKTTIRKKYKFSTQSTGTRVFLHSFSNYTALQL